MNAISDNTMDLNWAPPHAIVPASIPAFNRGSESVKSFRASELSTTTSVVCQDFTGLWLICFSTETYKSE